MIINNIKVRNDGYIYCKSNFYSAQDGLSYDFNFTFYEGKNKLVDEIDSGIWAVSYLLSMYKHKPEDFILFEQPQVTVNDLVISLDDFSEFSCYMDKVYPLFSTDIPVRELVAKGLRHHRLEYSPDEIKELFHLDTERFERPLAYVGNEIFRAMAAIGYSYEKQVYCFPWMSQNRFDSYHNHITDLLDILESLRKIVILPLGK